MSTELSLPIAERFHSIQGEGTWVGTPMHFIRLAGCPVGAKATRAFNGTLPILSTGNKASMCQTYDGRYFVCDTDFSLDEKLSVDELLGETHEKHICLTGGEPLAHMKLDAFQELFDNARDNDIMIHVESSGTINWMPPYGHWLTVAPKMGYLREMLHRADEIKYLVDENFDLGKVPIDFDALNIFLCPVNGELTVNQENVQRCLKILEKRPNWRLSFQSHKFLGLR